MSSDSKSIFLFVVGVLYLLLGVGGIMNTLNQDSFGLAPILWLCYMVMILIGIGVLTRNSLLVLSQLNIIFIPFLIWNLDFFFILFTGNPLFDVANYFFIPGPLIGKLITSQHIFTLPILIYTLYLLKIEEKRAWIISIVQIAFVFVITRMVSSPDENINCVFKSCTNFEFIGYYPLVWFVVFFMMIYVTNYLLTKIGFLIKR